MSEERDLDDPYGLLEEPTSAQVFLLEAMASAFVQTGGQWPVFEYLEEVLDDRGWDATTELGTMPRHPYGGYSWIVWGRGGAKPTPEFQIPLTLLGVYQAEVMNNVSTGLYELYRDVLGILVRIRREVPVTPLAVRSLIVHSDTIIPQLTSVPSYIDIDALPSLLWELLDHEPPTWGGGHSQGAAGWSRNITREVRMFGGLGAIGDYQTRLMAMMAQPALVTRPAVASPLGLVAALDYLDATWRLVPDHDARLFTLHSAQRTAQLAFAAATAAEFDSRLSGLAEILRSVKHPEGQSGSKKQRNQPLAPFERYLLDLLPDEAHGRITQAVVVLSDVLTIRDTAQHSAAGARGAAAFNRLGLDYPASAWAEAWDRIVEVTIQSLDTIREELAALSS
jgi:hypothetical protein